MLFDSRIHCYTQHTFLNAAIATYICIRGVMIHDLVYQYIVAFV